MSRRWTTGILASLLAVTVGLAGEIAGPDSPTVEPAGRRATARTEEIRALYFTGLMAGSEHGKQIATAWRASGGNAIVFDIKDGDGIVSAPSKLALAGTGRRTYIPNLEKWVAWLHQHGLYAIARIAVFKDQRLARAHPELAVHARDGRLWIDHGKISAWTDPSLRAVQDYDIGLALEAAAAGADEIQFDYIRFPVGGNQKDAVFHFESADPGATRADIITQFLYRAHRALAPTGVHISLDVFGVMAWARPEDLNATGQDILALSYFCDALSPMIYPSHFFHDFDGIADPGDAPAHFISVSLRRFMADTRDTGVVIRPWLQAFSWHAKTFGPNYIRIQVQTAREEGANGFCLWNANNRYGTVEEAMPMMMASPGTYFAGGYPYAIAEKSAGERQQTAGRAGR